MLEEMTREEMHHAEEGKCLVVFYTPSCPHCKILEKTLDEMQKSDISLRCYKMDISKNASVADDFSIRSVPTVLRFENKKVTARLVGNHTKSEIAAWLS